MLDAPGVRGGAALGARAACELTTPAPLVPDELARRACWSRASPVRDRPGW